MHIEPKIKAGAMLGADDDNYVYYGDSDADIPAESRGSATSTF
jgi:hypothetical protein